jgi:hypothetical protein
MAHRSRHHHETDAQCRQHRLRERAHVNYPAGPVEGLKRFDGPPDEATWLAGHHPEAITIFASGARHQGIDAIAAALHPHFVNKTAVWSWTELYRFVDGCQTGYVLYDTTYDIPSIGFHQRALTLVTYVHEGGKWLSIADQGFCRS